MDYQTVTDGAVRLVGVLGLGGLTVASVVALAWLVFKNVSGKWLDERFAQRFADYQHLQTLQGDRFRSDLAAWLDRAQKLHAQEFEVLPNIWDGLTLAMGQIGQIASPFQSEPDVVNMNADELEEALTYQPFKEREKETIRSLTGQERRKVYMNRYNRYRWATAHEAHRAFHNLVIQKSIFIEPDLRTPMREISGQLDDVLLFYRIHKLDDDAPMKTKDYIELNDLWKAATPMRDALLEKISARLWTMPRDTAEDQQAGADR